MTHGSLFSGIGGFDLAAEWMGWENVFHCEWNEFGQRVLHHYWPQAIQYNDITKTDFTIHRGRIDVLTGGFPCQPYSAAGKRLGKEDERHLWPEMLRAIREIQPRWVVGENVRGLVNWSGGLVFDEVQADLEAEGYKVLPFLLPACAKDAPHRRDRIWFVAFNTKCKPNGRHNTRKGSGIGVGMEGHELVEARWDKSSNVTGSPSINATSHSGIIGCDNGLDNRSERSIHNDEEWNAAQGESKREKRQCGLRQVCRDGDAADATIESGGRQLFKRQGQRQFGGCDSGDLPPGWQNFPTQPPICGGNDGLPTELDGITFSKWRNESIKAYGNAVVPQVVYEIFKAIEAF